MARPSFRALARGHALNVEICREPSIPCRPRMRRDGCAASKSIPAAICVGADHLCTLPLNWSASPSLDRSDYRSYNGDGSRYLSVLGGGTATFTFASAVSSFGFDYGSADTYNTLSLLFSGGGSQTFTGQDIIDIGTADGDQSSPRINGRVTIVGTPGQSIIGFTLASSQNSLEFDNLAVGSVVPEPTSWALLLVGFGAVGYSLRGRRVRTSLQAV